MNAEVIIRSSHPEPLRALIDPLAFVRSLWSRRGLIAQFTQREVAQRTRGTMLGVGWNILQPLITLTIYTFVFGVVFGVRWQREELAALDGRLDFVLHFFTGFLVFNLFSECLNAAPGIVLNRPNLVRKVVFPIETLPVSVFASTTVYTGIGLVLLLAVLLLAGGVISWTILALPLVLAPLAMLTLGLMWFLASLGVFIRDVRHVVTVITQLWFFVTPVFYPVERVPAPYQVLVAVNPMAIIVENARRIILWEQWPQWSSLGAVTAMSALIMLFGYAWFMKSRRGFADVL